MFNDHHKNERGMQHLLHPKKGMDMLQTDQWLDALVLGRKTSAGLESVLNIIRLDPVAASFMSTQDLADRADINVATVVRAAQFLGFSGWSALKSELRHRYLASMTAENLMREHDDIDAGSTSATFANDVQNLRVLMESVDLAQVRQVATIIADAPRTLVIATGSYAAAGYQLAHMGQLMGRDIELHTAVGTALVNRIRLLQPGDCLVSCNLWRSSKFVVDVARLCADRGARVVAIADRRTAVTDLAEEAILVPSEGVSFVPSIVGAVSAVQALLAEIAAYDPQRTTAALRDVEHMWSRLDLVDPA